jgi:phosphatidylglycerophosphatase B
MVEPLRFVKIVLHLLHYCWFLFQIIMKSIIYISIIVYAVLVTLVWLLPLPFSASSPNSIRTNISYAFTTSAGPYASLVILIGTAFCYTIGEAPIKEKIKKFVVSLLSLIVVFGIAAWLNENYTKPLYKFPRPSHQYILLTSKASTSIDSLYKLNKKERSNFFHKKITENRGLFKQVDTKIQSHWIEEAGFSFPSGHSFNAFLLAMIIGYAIYNNKFSPGLKKLYFIPFIWALLVAASRVAMGAHTALDVSGGSAMGILLGLSLLLNHKTRSLLT